MRLGANTCVRRSDNTTVDQTDARSGASEDSRGDKLGIERFVTGVRDWEAGMWRCMDELR